MSYKNIVFVKLLWKELLHEDDRFIEKLDDGQKGLYLMLLLLAGATGNNIPNSPEYLKRTLNLHEKSEIISQNLEKILETFGKFYIKDNYLKFKNFNKLHNYIWKRGGNPQELTQEALDKNRIEKNRIDRALQRFCLKYREKTGGNYVISYGKDRVIFRTLMPVLDDAELDSLIDRFFEYEDDFIKRAGYSVVIFKSQINKLRSVQPKTEGSWGRTL